jgi:hypothetical protein
LNQRRHNSSDELTPDDLFRPEPMDGSRTGGTIAGEVLYSSQETMPWTGAGQQQASGQPEYFGDATAIAPAPDYRRPDGGEASTQFLPPFPAAPAASTVSEWQPQQQQQPTYGGYQEQPQYDQQAPYEQPPPYEQPHPYQQQPSYQQQVSYQPQPQQGYAPPPPPAGGCQGGYQDAPKQGRPALRRPSNRLIAVVAVAACAVVGIVSAVALSGGGTSSAATVTPSASASSGAVAGAAAGADDKVQAQAMSDLLSTASNGRAAVISAVANVAQCQDIGQSQQDLSRAAGLRQQLIQQLGALQVNGLTGGSELVADLRKGWQESALADQHYAQWAAESKGSCGKSHKPVSGGALSQGDASSGRASAAKEKASKLWNAIAAQTGLPTRSSTQL